MNIQLIQLKSISDTRGTLLPVEFDHNFPISVKRVFYIANVPPGEARGHHAHKVLHQVAVCLKGAVSIKVRRGRDEEVFLLENTGSGIYLPPLTWVEMFDFSDDSVLAVYASDHYDESDYIREHSTFLKIIDGENV